MEKKLIAFQLHRFSSNLMTAVRKSQFGFPSPSALLFLSAKLFFTVLSNS